MAFQSTGEKEKILQSPEGWGREVSYQDQESEWHWSLAATSQGTRR